MWGRLGDLRTNGRVPTFGGCWNERVHADGVALGACDEASSHAHLGEPRLRVARDELVEHGALGRAPSETGERLSGRTGRSFVEAARAHARAQWKFRAARRSRRAAELRIVASAVRTPATTFAGSRGGNDVRRGLEDAELEGTSSKSANPRKVALPACSSKLASG